jgi:type IV pilus assembly protein PilV
MIRNSSHRIESRPRPGKQRLGRQRGVALLEVLISVLLLAVGLLGLVGLQTRAIGASVDAEDRNRASMLANEAISRMWLNRSVTLPAGELTAWQALVSSPADGGLPNGVGTVTPVTGLTDTADVTISWRPPNRDASEPDSRLSTRVTVNLP